MMDRLFGITYLLLDKKVMTAKALAQHFGVSTRTIYRDVETLSLGGIPIYATKGAGGGIRLTENFVLNKSVLTQDERQNILASLNGMQVLKTDEAKKVLDKMTTMFGGEREDWLEIDFSSWNPNCPVNIRFQLLKQAILSRKVLQFEYSSTEGETHLRTVEPLRLVFRERSWYLLGWCRLREDFRFFKLTRMGAPELLPQSFMRRPVPEKFFEQPMYQADNVTVRAKISPQMRYRVFDEFSAEQISKQADGTLDVTFEMPDSDWLYQYLMTYGADIFVISPENVRKELYRRLKNAAHQYEI